MISALYLFLGELVEIAKYFIVVRILTHFFSFLEVTSQSALRLTILTLCVFEHRVERGIVGYSFT